MSESRHGVPVMAVVQAHPTDQVGEMVLGGEKFPLPRFSVPTPTRTTTGAIEAMALYAGQSVGAVHRRQPAAEIVRELSEGSSRLLEGWSAAAGAGARGGS
jgi:hypothetical protein